MFLVTVMDRNTPTDNETDNRGKRREKRISTRGETRHVKDKVVCIYFFSFRMFVVTVM